MPFLCSASESPSKDAVGLATSHKIVRDKDNNIRFQVHTRTANTESCVMNIVCWDDVFRSYGYATQKIRPRIKARSALSPTERRGLYGPTLPHKAGLHRTETNTPPLMCHHVRCASREPLQWAPRKEQPRHQPTHFINFQPLQIPG